MHWLMIALLGLGATAPRLAGKVPAEGRWFASQWGSWGTGHFAILHLTPSGLSTVFSSTTTPHAFAWADADTLVTLEDFAAPFGLRWYDAGTLGTEIVLPATVAITRRPTFGVGPDGTAWLLDCEGAPACKGALVVRVTRDGVIDFPEEAPPDLRYPSTVGLKPVPVAPPDGYAATLTKVEIDGVSHRGATCTSPTGTTAWPDKTTDLEEAVRPWRATWVDADPPILALRGKVTHYRGHEYVTTSYFRACTMEALTDYRALGDGLWLHEAESLPTAVEWEWLDTWSLWWNDIHIDRIAGSASLVQMAPY